MLITKGTKAEKNIIFKSFDEWIDFKYENIRYMDSKIKMINIEIMIALLLIANNNKRLKIVAQKIKTLKKK